MDEHEELTDDASPNRALGRRRFLAGGVLGALAALLGRVPDAQADGGTPPGGPIIGGATNVEQATTTLLVPTPNTVAVRVDAAGPALSAASHGDTAVVASSFLTQQPPPLLLPRAASVHMSDSHVGLVTIASSQDLFGSGDQEHHDRGISLANPHQELGLFAAGGLDGLVSVTLTADSRVGLIAAGGLTGGISVTLNARPVEETQAVTVTNVRLQVGMLGVGGPGVLQTVTMTADAVGVAGLVDQGVGVAGSAGGAPLGGASDASVGVSGNAAGEGIAVSGNLFGATGTSPLASAALGVPHSVTVTVYGDGDLRSPDSATGGLFLGDIGMLAASFARPAGSTLTASPVGPFLVDGTFRSVTATAGVFLGDIGILAASFVAPVSATATAAIAFDRTAIIGLTDAGTAARFEALGSGIGVEVVGPSVFDGPVTFTVGGHATIPKRQKSVIVTNPNIRAHDLVTVTLNGNPGLGATVQHVVCHNGSFTLWLTNYVGFATPFSWVAFRIG